MCFVQLSAKMSSFVLSAIDADCVGVRGSSTITMPNGLIKVAGSVVADTVSAGTAAACVAPFVVAVDKAIAENASGRKPLWSSFFGTVRELGTAPVLFLRQPAFRYLTALFGGTYLAANLFYTLAEKRPRLSHPLLTATGVFVCNSSLSLWKDSAFRKAVWDDDTQTGSMECSWLMVVPRLHRHDDHLYDATTVGQDAAQARSGELALSRRARLADCAATCDPAHCRTVPPPRLREVQPRWSALGAANERDARRAVRYNYHALD